MGTAGLDFVLAVSSPSTPNKGHGDSDLSPVLTKMWEVDAKLRKEREMGKVVEKEKMG